MLAQDSRALFAIMAIEHKGEPRSDSAVDTEMYCYLRAQ